MTDSLTYLAISVSISLKNSLSIFGQTACGGGSFIGLPKWYKYLGSQGTGGDCVPRLNSISDIWLIVLAVVEILIRIAAIGALIFIIYGGIRYITARGNPEKIDSARKAIQDALIGLVIAIAAVAMVNFLGSRFTQ